MTNARKQLAQVSKRVQQDVVEMIDTATRLLEKAQQIEAVVVLGTEEQVQTYVDVLKRECPELFGN